MTGCLGPSADPPALCGREVYARGLCSGHYRQWLERGRVTLVGLPDLGCLTPLRTARGTAGRVVVRSDQALITAMATAADADKIEPPEAWRRAARTWLAEKERDLERRTERAARDRRKTWLEMSEQKGEINTRAEAERRADEILSGLTEHERAARDRWKKGEGK